LLQKRVRKVDLEIVTGKKRGTEEEQVTEAIKEFHKARPGWSLLPVARCPASNCGRPLYCKKHKYGYRKYWINFCIAMKQ
jgi:hypothetical protein